MPTLVLAQGTPQLFQESRIQHCPAEGTQTGFRDVERGVPGRGRPSSSKIRPSDTVSRT